MTEPSPGKVPYSPALYDGSARTGAVVNCGYHGTAGGWIVRDGTLWIATFGSQALADEYVAMRRDGNGSSAHE